MDLEPSADERAFRGRLRSWLAEHAPTEALSTDLDERHAALIAWWKLLYDAGWAGLSWPSEYGGQGCGPVEEAILSEELGRCGAPPPPMLGYIGRTLLTFGSDEQRHRYLPAMLRCDEQWCQGFSEPGAGSDLASLQTRAEDAGDAYVITGQKVWTTWAKFANYCLVLARTKGEGPRHATISAFVVDLTSPGVVVRPLVLANGDEEFAEIFLDGVRVPKVNLVGDLGDGWKIAMQTISYERGPLDIGYQAKFDRMLRQLCSEAESMGRLADPSVARSLAELAVALEVQRLHTLRSLTTRIDASGPPGAEGSVDKLLMTGSEQLLTRVALDVLGPSVLVDGSPWFDDYLYSRSASIYGGTSQIQRNIIATRLLGMPRG